MKKKETAKIIEKVRLAEDIYSLWIETEIAEESAPGQFVMVYPKAETRLLGRPISICESERGRLRLVFRTVGAGTREFAGYETGDTVELLGPLGNGFPIEEGRALLIGGGIGIPPLLGLARARKKEDNLIVAGYRTEDTYLTGDLSDAGILYTAIEKLNGGGAGKRSDQPFLNELSRSDAPSKQACKQQLQNITVGNVLDAIAKNSLKTDIIYSCGPMPMLAAVKSYAEKNGICAYLSLEERMACGVGACLGCVCKTKEIDAHSKVKNARVCKEGPVFAADAVEL